MKKDQKIKTVENLKDKVTKAKSMVLADYRGLTHQQLEELKKAMKKIGAEFVVTKNTLLKLALPKSKVESLESKVLEGPTATLFAYEDEIAPLGVLAKFMKNFGLMTVKIGLLGDKTLTPEEVQQLASLPSREVLLSTLVARLKGPIYGLHYSLNWNLQKLSLVLKAASEKSQKSA